MLCYLHLLVYRDITMWDGQGKAHVCRLRLGAFIADLQEQWDVLCLKHMRDVSTLATRDDFGNPDSRPPPRLQQEMVKVKEICFIFHDSPNDTREPYLPCSL